MVAQNVDLITNFLIGKDQVTVTAQNISKQIQGIGRLSQQGLISTTEANRRLEGVKSRFSSLGGEIDGAFRRGQRSANQFDARLLSVLFAGFALQRAFGGLLRSTVDTFTKAENNTSELSKGFTSLRASTEFLKFSLIDAFDNDIFVGFIDGIVSTFNAIAELPEGVRRAITIVIASLAALGTGALIYAQIRLAWGAIFGTGGLLATQAVQTAGAVKGVGTAVTVLNGATVAGLAASLAALTASALVLLGTLRAIEAFTAQEQEQPDITFADQGFEEIENLEQTQQRLADGASGLTTRFSNLNKGFDSTIETTALVNQETGKLVGNIVTVQDKVDEYINGAGQDYFEQNQEVAESIRSVVDAQIAETLSLEELNTEIERNIELRSRAEQVFRAESFRIERNSSVLNDR